MHGSIRAMLSCGLLSGASLFAVEAKSLQEVALEYPMSASPEHCSLRNRLCVKWLILVYCNRLRWQNVPREYGPAKTLYNRWKSWEITGKAPMVRGCP